MVRPVVSFLITLRGIDWTAAILAGGRATRMGGADKATLSVGGRSVLARQIEVLRALTPHLLIVARDLAISRTAGAPVVTDDVADAGPLGGIWTALRHASTSRVLVVACDMPFLSPRLLTALVEAVDGVDVALPRDAGGIHPLCACYQAHVAAQLGRCIETGVLAVRAAIAPLAVREIGPDDLRSLDADGRALWNVNTPEDYARACAVADEAPPAA